MSTGTINSGGAAAARQLSRKTTNSDICLTSAPPKRKPTYPLLRRDLDLLLLRQPVRPLHRGGAGRDEFPGETHPVLRQGLGVRETRLRAPQQYPAVPLVGRGQYRVRELVRVVQPFPVHPHLVRVDN